MLCGVGAQRVELAEHERRVVKFAREGWLLGLLLRCGIEPHVGLPIGSVGLTSEDLVPVLTEIGGLGVGP